MKPAYINELKSGERLAGFIAGVSSAEKRSDKNGNPYYDLQLMDNTGIINAKIWGDNIPGIRTDLLEPGEVVSVTGSVTSYRDQLQINVDQIDEPSTNEYEMSDLQNVSEISPEGAKKRILGYIDKISDNALQKLIRDFLSENEQSYYQSSAAKVNHHGFLGGLVEHTLEMLDIAWSIKEYYPKANYDIIIAAIILHDMGKVWELEKVGFAVEYTVEGKLIGHIVMVIEKLNQFVMKNYKNSDEVLASRQYLLLKHAVLAHHGKMEYGSPVVPLTIEAEIVSKADDLSWSTRAFQRVTSENVSKDMEVDEKFASRDFALGRNIFVSTKTNQFPKLSQKDSDGMKKKNVKTEKKPNSDTEEGQESLI